MDNDDPQRQLRLLILELSAEKTKGERRLSDLQKRHLELQADYEAANVELEKTKRVREAAERELRGSQAQLDRTNALLLAMEKRNSGLRDEISQVSSEMQAIMVNDAKIQRDEFIRTMQEFNTKIRKFNEMAIQSLKKGHPDITAVTDQGVDVQNENTLKELENEIMSVDAEMLSLNEEYQKMVHDANKVQEEVANLQKRISLSEAILLQSERLKDLSAQISELEKTCSFVGEELQKKYTCPKCQFNNMETSEWTSEAEETAAN